ncbi:DNA-binding HxlR family transcriptional regulator [Chryseobacterium sp. PvR013]|uniref:winged helix-turn-helix transcriptional regulator n=1 Tax=Chryseobacterium sp. PvR013 TaxID=2806595 RepID=UPI001B4B0FA3|nr:helix-turn-helix domain-containing protein [Chryseobacterium sp. PvR013]MBP1168015.1 DNA-binding HxlR family transcriptional regulator [Chryseobacterium sp. PvR013]
MEEYHDHKECLQALRPIRDTLDIISGKWKLQIIISVNAGNRRFTEIRKSIPKLTPKVLAKELKELEQNGLIERIVTESYPVIIEYFPTDYTSTLDQVVTSLQDWGENHRRHIFGTTHTPAEKSKVTETTNEQNKIISSK